MSRASKHARMYDHIVKHGEQLIRVFGLMQWQGRPVELCKTLLRIETKTHRAAEQYCNGEIDADQWEKISDNARDAVCKILGNEYRPWILINGDPRGYALKIDDTIMREKQLHFYSDWGGYGILAPDFSEGD